MSIKMDDKSLVHHITISVVKYDVEECKKCGFIHAINLFTAYISLGSGSLSTINLIYGKYRYLYIIFLLLLLQIHEV